MTRGFLCKVAWVGRTAAMLFGLALVMVLVLGAATAALAAVPGDPFKLGKVNKINALTTLAGNTAAAMLKVDNNGAGPALTLEVGGATNIPSTQTAPPMTINSQVKVEHLNADKVDGRDAPLWAVVTSSGSLDRSNGAVSATRISTGHYEVVFARDVSECAHLVTREAPPGEISVSQDSTNNDLVSVFTSNSSGTLTDNTFHLTAIC